jgi:formate C-acetyltransferase
MAIIGIIKGIEHPMHNHPQWGRADQNLRPYLINDLNNGTITVERAVDLLSELIGRWGKQILVDTGSHKETHQLTYGINGVNICGITPDGKEGTNEVSYMFLHVVGLLKQSSPTVVIRWNRDTPDWFMRKAIKVNVLTRGGIPLFENEEPIIEHFVADGIPREEARNWNGLGCVWPVLPQRGEYKGGAAGFSAAAMLHLALHNGVAITGKKLGLETGDPKNFKTFDELFDAFSKQYKFIMHRTLWLANLARDEQYKYLRLPFLSTMSLQYCMDKGKDTMVPDLLSQFGITDRAIIDATDALMGVKKLVYDDKKLTMAEMMEALDNNFEGPRGAEIQKMCLEAPKFGNDIDEVDLLARRVSIMSAETVTSWDNSPYQNFKSVREGLSWHYAAGKGVGALPNGRKALEPLDDGSASPMRGMDKNGPTAVLRSIIKAGFYDHSYVQALNQKFPIDMIKTDADVDKMVAYTNAFLLQGGTNIMYNLVDSKEMQEAKIKPEEHEDLIVRVGGFSAYFVELTPQIQDDIILRSEHTL